MTVGSPFYQSLRFKVILGVILILMVVLSAVFVLQYRWYRHEMIERLGLSSTPLSDVIKGSLKHAMQSRNPEEISTIIRNIRAQKGVERVFITDKRGTIKFSADPGDLGRHLNLSDPTCQICHRYEAENRNKTVIFSGKGAGRFFRNVLILSLGLTLSVTVLTIASIMNRMILSPLRRFVEAIKLLKAGRLDQKVTVEGQDEIGQLAVAFNEMVETLRRAKDLRERKELLESVLNNVEEAIVVIDPEGTIISFSSGAEKTFGYRPEEVLGKPYALLGEERQGVLKSVKRGGIVNGEARLKSRQGRYFPARTCVMPLRSERDEVLAFVEIVRDLTEERIKERLKQQLVQSEKLAAVGQLAAGVAHELNNPLGHILLYAKLLEEELEPDDPRHRSGRTIVENTLRCKEIVKNLLDYARESEVQMRLHDLNEIARSSVKMLANEMRIHNIERRLVLAEDLPKVSYDRNQILQVFVNLLQNAIQAVENHGRITVLTSTSKGGEGSCSASRITGWGCGPRPSPGSSSLSTPPRRKARAWDCRSATGSCSATREGSGSKAPARRRTRRGRPRLLPGPPSTWSCRSPERSSGGRADR